MAPEAAAGGPLAAVHNGDWISMDCDSGALNLEVDDAEIARRLAEADPMAASNQIATTGGYRQLYIERVLQADEGCDFDFLRGCRGAEVPRHSH